MTWTLPIVVPAAAEEADDLSFCTDSPLLRLPIGSPEPSAAGCMAAYSHRVWAPTPRVAVKAATASATTDAWALTSPC
jgi:hypothetical protein